MTHSCCSRIENMNKKHNKTNNIEAKKDDC